MLRNLSIKQSSINRLTKPEVILVTDFTSAAVVTLLSKRLEPNLAYLTRLCAKKGWLLFLGSSYTACGYSASETLPRKPFILEAYAQVQSYPVSGTNIRSTGRRATDDGQQFYVVRKSERNCNRRKTSHKKTMELLVCVLDVLTERSNHHQRTGEEPGATDGVLQVFRRRTWSRCRCLWYSVHAACHIVSSCNEYRMRRRAISSTFAFVFIAVLWCCSAPFGVGYEMPTIVAAASVPHASWVHMWQSVGALPLPLATSGSGSGCPGVPLQSSTYT